MNNSFKLVMIACILSACSPKHELVRIVDGQPGAVGAPGADGSNGANGKDGVSCSVVPELDTETHNALGARISCTDGSYSVIYNGENGVNGLTGTQGLQGIQGPVGQTGANGQNAQACQAYRVPFLGAFLKCPDQWPVLIADGKDGKDGEDGASCSSERQNSQERVKITCSQGNHIESVSYVYDGETGAKGDKGSTGAAGTSCTVTPLVGGAKVQCGNSSVTLANGATGSQGTPGTPGAQGPGGLNGKDGTNGADGRDGEDAVQPGLSCNVHNLANWDGITNILTVLSASPAVGSFVLPNLNVGDSPSANGFPGMPSSLQNQVGTEGYALDCNGYLNVETSGLYSFSLLSDDGVRLLIDGQTIVNDPGLHAPTTDAKSNVELQRGQRPFNVIYYQGPATQIALQLQYSGPNLTQVVVPTAKFTH